MNPEDRMRVMEACLVLPGQGWAVHFTLMMLMSVIVAVMGLSTNSAALVIGAMLIAPLMTPVLGIAAAISMALTDAIWRTLTTVALATIGAIALSWLLAGALPGELLTSEVLARTAPDARDLVVALAAGVAGSYATARPDVSNSLPGVAIAVALVPPLGVVGITARAGEWDLATGALLLFATNLAAIVTVSTVVFLLAGFVPGRRLWSMAPRVLIGGLIGGALVIALAFVLIPRSIESARLVDRREAVEAATTTWLGGTFNTAEIAIQEDVVQVRVIGSTQPPETSEFQSRIDAIFGEPTDLRVTWIQGQTAEGIQVSARAAALIRDTNVVSETVIEWLNATGTPDAYEVTALTADPDLIVVEVASIIAVPASEDLRARLDQKLGLAPVIEVRARDLSAEAALAGQATIDEIEADSRRAAQDWALSRLVSVDQVRFDGTILTVDLAGNVRPDGAELDVALREVVGSEIVIDVGFVERQSVIPAPTPTPTALPTAVPTALPTATPEPTATPLSAADPDASPTPG